MSGHSEACCSTGSNKPVVTEHTRWLLTYWCLKLIFKTKKSRSVISLILPLTVTEAAWRRLRPLAEFVTHWSAFLQSYTGAFGSGRHWWPTSHHVGRETLKFRKHYVLFSSRVAQMDLKNSSFILHWVTLWAWQHVVTIDNHQQCLHELYSCWSCCFHFVMHTAMHFTTTNIPTQYKQCDFVLSLLFHRFERDALVFEEHFVLCFYMHNWRYIKLWYWHSFA